MTTRKDNRGKDRSRPPKAGSPGAVEPKKPYATLNLKAKDVSPKAGGAGEADKPGGTPQSGKPVQSSVTSSSSGRPGETETGEARNTSKSGVGSAAVETPPNGHGDDSNATGGSARGATAKRGVEKTAPAEGSKPKSGSRIGSTLSHLSAGALGGFLAFFGAGAIAPTLQQMGIPVAGTRVDVEKTTAELSSRLGALETLTGTQSTTDTAALEAQINATDAKLAELEALSGTVADLGEQQARLVAQVAAGESATAKSSDVGAIAQRVASLEKVLETIEAAAGQGGRGGGLANLSVISGRLVDLETTLNNQMAALRASVGSDIETRFSSVAEASEAARSGTQRMDRRLATITTDTARISQRLEVLNADADRLVEEMRVVREETGTIKSAVSALEGDVRKTVEGLATHGDVDTAVAAVLTQIDALRHNVGQVVRSESERKENARRIVLSLELANLKRALDRGEPYSPQLLEVRKASGNTLDLSKLEAYETTGVATVATLEASFRPVANAIIDAAREPVEGSVVDQLLAGARSIVRVRKLDHSADDTSAEAIVGRIEKALKAGQLDQVIKAAQTLSSEARAPAQDWLSQVAARRSVGSALFEIEAKLKASLSGSSAANDAAPAPTTNAN